MLKTGVLLALLLCATLSDVKSYRIDNRLILFGLLLGGSLHFQASKDAGWICLFQDLMIPVLVLYPLWRMRIIGAGDIKLICIISIIETFQIGLKVCFYGGVLVSVYAVEEFIRGKGERLKNRNLPLSGSFFLAYIGWLAGII